MIGTKIHYSQADDVTIIERVQNCDPVLCEAKMLREDGATGSNEMRHAAHFPAILVEQYCNDKGITLHEFLKDKKHAKSMLNDPALKGFRVWEGRV